MFIKTIRIGILSGCLVTAISAQSPADVTYVVKKGDTLWDIAFSLWGDNFLWPDLWHANPQINNPDLIFPGDVLRIPNRNGSEDITSGTDTINTSLNSDIIEKPAVNDSLENQYNQTIIDSSFISDFTQKSRLDNSFFAKVPFLWFDPDPQGNIYPGKGIVRNPSSASYQRFDKLVIEPQQENYFNVGDTLDIYTSLRFVEIEGKTANLVKRSGRCRVVESAPRKVTAVLFDQWDVITGNERADKSDHYFSGTIDTVTTPSISITGAIFIRVEQTPSLYPFQTVIIDKGENDGVQRGDIFGLYHTGKKTISWKLSAIGIALHINKTSSSLLLISLMQNELDEGDKAVLVRKAQFTDKEQ
ncbi:MAG TPA: LysM peptidoglycan-binding domain-containing protein [Chitinispirillaceae bacterium]|nr:LysM peptidoglycan-binding domain-containing protein [Chitinispirillaceae bacterium]